MPLIKSTISIAGKNQDWAKTSATVAGLALNQKVGLPVLVEISNCYSGMNDDSFIAFGVFRRKIAGIIAH